MSCNHVTFETGLHEIISAWQVVDLAVQAYGFCSVSLYDTLGKDAVGTYVETSTRIYTYIMSRVYVSVILSVIVAHPTRRLQY